MKHNRIYPARSRMNRPAKMRAPLVSERDLAPIRLSGPNLPPQNQVNPTVTRIVRLTLPYNGIAINTPLSAVNIAAQDAFNYTSQSTTVRYTQLRLLKVEAWFGLNTPGVSTITLDVHDSFSNNDFTDVVAQGVDYAHVAYRPGLVSRSTFFATSGSTSLVGINVPASEGAIGQVVIDFTVAFC